MKTNIKLNYYAKVGFILFSLLMSPIIINKVNSRTPEQRKIQIALLLDTSSSMEGLIEQAKSQLWLMVSELTKATCEGQDPKLEIALYEYGNDGLSFDNGYIRQVSPLISDLDDVSASLFSLSTNGGSEYCGYVIDKTIKDLEWVNQPAILK